MSVCFRLQAERTDSVSFCFSAFQSPFSALTRCFCTTVFLSSDHRDYFLFQTLLFFINFSSLWNIPTEVKIIIVIIIILTIIL